MKKQNNKLNAVICTLIALALFIWSFFSDYPNNRYILIGAILVSVCAFYWIRKKRKNEKDKEIDKFMKEQHTKVKQEINRRYIMKPLLKKKMEETGRDYFTEEDLDDIEKRALKDIDEGKERRKNKNAK